MQRHEAEDHVRSIARRCRGPLHPESAKVKNALLADGRLEEAAAEDAAGRPGCGADVNDIICAEPFDGQGRTATCPQCGQTINYTSPRYELDAPEGDAP